MSVMDGFESALKCLGDIVRQDEKMAQFDESITCIRFYFPECDIYVASGINVPRGRVSVGMKRREQKKATACVFRFMENIDGNKIYLNFNLNIGKKSEIELRNKFNSALKSVGGIDKFERIESGKRRYGISIDNSNEVKEILNLVAKSELNKKMKGKTLNPDDYNESRMLDIYGKYKELDYGSTEAEEGIKKEKIFWNPQEIEIL